MMDADDKTLTELATLKDAIKRGLRDCTNSR